MGFKLCEALRNEKSFALGYSMSNCLKFDMTLALPPSILMQSLKNLHIGLIWTFENRQNQR